METSPDQQDGHDLTGQANARARSSNSALDPRAPKRRNRVARWAVYSLALAAALYWTHRPRPPVLGRGIGQRVPALTLVDVRTNRTVRLADLRGKRGLVLAFLSVDCPIANLYLPRLDALAHAYEPRGIAIVAVNANAHEPADAVAAHAREHGVSLRALKDEGNAVADRLQVERTCEVLLIDAHDRLRYRGAIDDQYGLGTRKPAPAREYLAEALDALLAGQSIATTETPAFGCPIERAERAAAPKIKLARDWRPTVRPAVPEIASALEAREPPVTVGNVTYAGDVAFIMQNRCQACHRPGQVGPFSLLTYAQAKRWATSIREVVEDRRMPPWHADPRYGRFANDRSLTARERATLLAWVDQGTPLGDESQLPPPRQFAEGWSIGEPDAVFEMPGLYTVCAEGVLPYQHFRVATHFSEDKWIQAAEVRPGDRAVVHHIFVRVEPHNYIRPRGMAPDEPYLVGYAPGDMPAIFPPGTAKLIPAGSDLTFEIHYTPVGIEKTDRSSVGLIFATQPPARRVITKGIKDESMIIPPSAPNHPISASYTFPTDVYVLSLMPHMHLRGKDFLYTATFPDGRTETLLWVPAYDFGWQSIYRLEEPLLIPRGTRIDVTGHFDNSSANPANPDPTQTVRWGEQTFDEMMIGYVDYCSAGSLPPPTPLARKPRETGTRAR